MKFEHDNMANLLLFEVEVGGRNIVIGGFTTHGWVAGLNENEDGEEDEVSQGVDSTVQGSNGSFIFNLTDNLRFDEMTTPRLCQNIWYYTRAFPEKEPVKNW